MPMTTPPGAGLRLPRQAPGINRSGARPAAVAQGDGVAADGLFTWLFGESDITRTLDDIGNDVLAHVPFGSSISSIGDLIIPG